MMVVALKHVGTTAWLSEMLKMSVKLHFFHIFHPFPDPFLKKLILLFSKDALN